MNAKQLIAAVIVLAATGTAFSQEYVRPDANFISTKTRAEVVAEFKQAQSEGLISSRDDTYPVAATVVAAPRLRKEVRAESIQTSKSQSGNVSSIYFGG